MAALKYNCWALTINQGTKTWPEWYAWIDSDENRFFAGQEENAPTTGNRHIQAYVSYTDKLTHEQVRAKWPGCYVAARFRSPKVLREYVLKETSRRPGGHNWESGVLPLYSKRQDCQDLVGLVTDGATNLQLILHNAQLFGQMRNVLMEYRDLISGNRTWFTNSHVFWGGTGMGKSRRAEHIAMTYDKWDYVMVGHKGARMWWDGCELAKCIVVEDYDGEWTMRTLLKVLDRYKLRVEIKGGHCNFIAEMVIFTSNKHPREWYPDIDYDGSPLQRRLRDHGEVEHHVVEWLPPVPQVLGHMPSDVESPPGTPLEDEQPTALSLLDQANNMEDDLDFLTGYALPIFDI